jgi:hypothetical protein
MNPRRRLVQLETLVAKLPPPPPPQESREAGLARAERRLRTIAGRLEGRLGPCEYEPTDLAELTDDDRAFIEGYQQPIMVMMVYSGPPGTKVEREAEFVAMHGFRPWQWTEKHGQPEAVSGG